LTVGAREGAWGATFFFVVVVVTTVGFLFGAECALLRCPKKSMLEKDPAALG